MKQTCMHYKASDLKERRLTFLKTQFNLRDILRDLRKSSNIRSYV